MKKLLILICVVAIFAMSCHFPSSSSNIQTNSITSDKPIIPKEVNIIVIPGPGDYLVDRDGNEVSVLLKSVSPIYADVMPIGYYDPGKQAFGKPGDSCLVLPFQVESEIPKEQYLNIQALGYDSNDNLVSYCLNSGPIHGSTVINMKPNSINDGNFFLSPSRDLVKVKIQVLGLSDIVPP